MIDIRSSEYAKPKMNMSIYVVFTFHLLVLSYFMINNPRNEVNH